jgi:putative acetyltransferase
MPAIDPVITLERLNESHIEGITALYHDPMVARQTLQMPFPSSETCASAWRRTTNESFNW